MKLHTQSIQVIASANQFNHNNQPQTKMKLKLPSMKSYFKSMTPMGVSKRQGDFAVNAEYYWREGDGNDPLTEQTAEQYQDMPELFDGEVKQQWRVIFISGEPSDMEHYEIYHFKRFNKWSEAEKFCALLKERRKAGSLKLSPQFWHLEHPFNKRRDQYERV